MLIGFSKMFSASLIKDSLSRFLFPLKKRSVGGQTTRLCVCLLVLSFSMSACQLSSSLSAQQWISERSAVIKSGKESSDVQALLTSELAWLLAMTGERREAIRLWRSTLGEDPNSLSKVSPKRSTKSRLAEELSLLGLSDILLEVALDKDRPSNSATSNSATSKEIPSLIRSFERLLEAKSSLVLALAWGNAFTLLSTLDEGSDQYLTIRGLSLALVKRWSVVQSSYDSYPEINCQPLKSTRATKSQRVSLLHSSYKCVTHCPLFKSSSHSTKRPKAGDPLLALREPYAFSSFQIGKRVHKRGGSEESSLLNSLPSTGRLALISASNLGCSRNTPTHNTESDLDHPPTRDQLTLYISGEMKPRMMWFPSSPIIPDELIESAPSTLINLWSERLRLILHLNTLRSTLKFQDWIALSGNADAQWEIFKEFWRPSPPNDQESVTPQKTVGTASLLCGSSPYQSHQSDSGNGVYFPPHAHSMIEEVKRTIQACALTHASLPKEWLRLYNQSSAKIQQHKRSAPMNEDPLLDPDTTWRISDRLIALGVPIEKVIPPLIRRFPSSPQALPWMKTYPEWIPGRRPALETVKPQEMIKTFMSEPWIPLLKGNMGQLLDYQSLYYTSNGEGGSLGV